VTSEKVQRISEVLSITQMDPSADYSNTGPVNDDDAASESESESDTETDDVDDDDDYQSPEDEENDDVDDDAKSQSTKDGDTQQNKKSKSQKVSHNKGSSDGQIRCEGRLSKR
jgi:hypothetical protein